MQRTNNYNVSQKTARFWIAAQQQETFAFLVEDNCVGWLGVFLEEDILRWNVWEKDITDSPPAGPILLNCLESSMKSQIKWN